MSRSEAIASDDEYEPYDSCDRIAFQDEKQSITPIVRKPMAGFEPATARLRIECRFVIFGVFQGFEKILTPNLPQVFAQQFM
ncbi:MAG: hypothetical protein F6K19_08660 [Cyanothece sp. SIO1E1]|nr:hypothetical protein [Cyanothece sp. SIO1E1]